MIGTGLVGDWISQWLILWDDGEAPDVLSGEVPSIPATPDDLYLTSWT